MVDRFLAFVRSEPGCLDRSTLPGHVTASAVVLSAGSDRVLLTLHRKLGKWLQLGGHADGQPEPHDVALREAEEESGLPDLAFAPPAPWSRLSVPFPVPFDLDVHEIPATAREPAHWHFDVRYLLETFRPSATRVTSESVELRWFPLPLEAAGWETSLTRLFDKALFLRDIQKARSIP